MKVTFTITLFVVFFFSFVLQSNQGKVSKFHVTNKVEAVLSSVNPPAARTGAPGELNCTSCHMGTIQAADGIIDVTFSGVGNEYVVGELYSISISIASGSKNGFEMTILDNTNAKAGTFTVGTNTSITSSGGRQYIRQNASVGISSWTFNWTAPETDVGDLTAYYTFNKSNAMGNTGGDVIYMGQFTISSAVFNTLTEYEKEDQDYFIYYDKQAQELHFSYQLTVDSKVVFTVSDLTGGVIERVDFGKEIAGKYMKRVPFQYNGKMKMYIVSLFINNNVYTRKVMI